MHWLGVRTKIRRAILYLYGCSMNVPIAQRTQHAEQQPVLSEAIAPAVVEHHALVQLLGPYRHVMRFRTYSSERNGDGSASSRQFLMGGEGVISTH